MDYERLSEIAGRFGQASERCAELERRVQAAFGPLADGGWLGRGSASFGAEMDAVVFPAAQRLVAALDAAREVTLQIRATLLAAEQEAAGLFQGDARPGSIEVQGISGGNTPAPSGNPFAHFSPLDWVQLGLDLFGFIPVIGEPADFINALISAGRGDWVGAGLSLAALWPAGGQAATIGKIAAKYGDEIAAVIGKLDFLVRGSDEAIAAGEALRSGRRVDDLLREGKALSEQDWRRLIDDAETPQLADDLRYQRYRQDKLLDGADEGELLPREAWQARKDVLEANRLRGRADEDAALDELGFSNNNHRRVEADGSTFTPVQGTAIVDGKPITTRPDAITDRYWIDVKSVDVSGATPDQPRIVYDVQQQQAQRALADADGGKGVAVVLSSRDADLVQPSGPLGANNTVFHRNPETSEWRQWDAVERRWDDTPLTADEAQRILSGQ